MVSRRLLLPVTLKCSLNLMVAPGFFCATAVRGLACHACFVLFEQSKLLDTNCSETEYSHESVSSTKSPRRPKRMKSLKTLRLKSVRMTP